MVFKQDPPFMLKEAMEALIDITDWYASSPDNFIWMYNVKKPSHVLAKFSLDVLIMKKVSYHILAGLTTRLHQNKKAHWPALPLQIGLY